MQPAISVENLSKQFQLGRSQGHPDPQLREFITDGVKNLWAGLRGRRGRTGENEAKGSFWALNDISFVVQPGEVVGIIGRNGAGKSTLLKILSRIAEPTAGRAVVRGRMGSLLEVGTGFHPELTGRENIFLNGSILGMSRVEVRHSFDEIVAFAEIEQFLDTPVKRYSSGMYVRLAFAVAAHLEPEILIVDEVLAVGDIEFQRKCIHKMRDVGAHGRTVLFVSHQLSALQQLCTRGIILRNGSVSADLPIDQAVRAYLHTVKAQATQPIQRRTDRNGAGQVRLTAVRISMHPDAAPNVLCTGQPAEFEFELSEVRRGLDVRFTIYDDHGRPVTQFDTRRVGPADSASKGTARRVLCRIDHLPLLAGTYRINAAVLLNGRAEDHVEGAAAFDVQDGLIDGRQAAGSDTWGKVHLTHAWMWLDGEDCASPSRSLLEKSDR